jgi:hypothetical protein
MSIYSIANVENLKLYEPSMLDRGNDGKVLLIIYDLAPEAQLELIEDVVFPKKSITTR